VTIAQRARELAPGFVLVAGVAAIAGAMILLPTDDDPRFAPIGPIMTFSALLGEAVTAGVFFAAWRHSERRSTFVLSLSFGVNAILLAVALLVGRLLPATPPMVWAPPQAGVWLALIGHVMAGIGALAYLAYRDRDEAEPRARRFIVGAGGVAVLILAICLACAGVLGTYVPVVDEPSLLGIATSGLGALVSAFLIAVAVRTFLVRDPNVIDRALTLALIAMMFHLLLQPLAPRFSTAFYAAHALLVLGGLFVLVAALRTLVLARVRLREVENESFKRAGRIRAVWEIARFTALPDGDTYDTLLGIATAAMRPGMPMFGTLSHLVDDDIVIDASEMLSAGASFPRASMLENRLVTAGRTMAWDDLNRSYGIERLVNADELRSFIGTAVTIGGQTYFLAFASPEPMLIEPFVDDDLAYVDVVASFFASSFTQHHQFERIQFQIEHDALTGLKNRVQFRKAVRDEIRAGRAFTLAFLDLDGFRHLNARYGHQIGDEVLVEVAVALGSVCTGDLIARMSADEYGLLLRNARPPEQTPGELERYADLFTTPFQTGDREGTQLLSIGASIGAARYPLDGSTAEDIMLKADIALKVAKNRGGSCTMIFDAPMGAVLEESDLRVAELSNAISQDQLALVYQPTFDLATREITGAEALVRWDHPERGRLPPSEFIDFAERNGLIPPLTRWVFRRVVRDLSRAPLLPPGARVYFNVSALMLDDIGFITEINETLRRDAKLVARLGIEVTETAAMENVERSMNTIDLFRSWGLTVAIDDFGTGYSSLSYLKRLRIDVVKIDRSFISGLPDDERDTVVAEMLLEIIKRFGFATLAEGIETEAQATWLLEHGCRYGQGYLVARPASFDVMLERMGVPHAA